MARSFISLTRSESAEIVTPEEESIVTSVDGVDVEHTGNEIQEDIDKIEDHINAASELEEVTDQMGTNIAAIEAEGPTVEMEEVKAESDNPEEITANIEDSASGDLVPTLDKETMDTSPTIVQDQLIEAQVASEAYARIISGAKYQDLARHYNVSYIRTESITRSAKPYKQYIIKHEGLKQMLKKAYIAVRNFIMRCIHRITAWMQQIRLYFNNIDKDIKTLEEKLKVIKDGKENADSIPMEKLAESEDANLYLLRRDDAMALLRYHLDKLEEIGNKKDLTKLLDIENVKKNCEVHGEKPVKEGFIKKLEYFVFPSHKPIPYSKASNVFAEQQIAKICEPSKEFRNIMADYGNSKEPYIMAYCYFRRARGTMCIVTIDNYGEETASSGFKISQKVHSFSLLDDMENFKANNYLSKREVVDCLDEVITILKHYARKFPDMVKKSINALEVFKNKNLEQTLDGKSGEEARLYEVLMKLSNLAAVGISGTITGAYSQISWALSTANRYAKAYGGSMVGQDYKTKK